MFNKQPFINKLSLRFKIILAILLSLVVSFAVFILWQPKKNNIPVVPTSLLVQLNQNESGDLTVRSVSLQDRYPQDYQLNLDSNYYIIELKKADQTLFTGKTVKSDITVYENFHDAPLQDTSELVPTDNSNDEQVYFKVVEDPTERLEDSRTTELPLNDFNLNLPYFKDAEVVVISDENGEEILNVNLQEYDLKAPEGNKNTCGDGICSDHENILMCRADCSYKLPTLFKK